MKELNEMTLEELWELFPIFLVPHNPLWKSYYIEMESYLSSSLMNFNKRISHIGSTAILDIWAKNIVDILIEVDTVDKVTEIAEKLKNEGFNLVYIEDGRAHLNKGYTKNGFLDKVYHLHIRVFGDNNELYFRDYLNEHQEIAKEYEALKLSLWHQYEHNRDGYTNAKGEFITKYTEIAKKEYKGKY